VFRVEVIQVRPRWFDVEIDWTDGRRGMPVPTVPQWHSQFLSMVTPPQAQPFGAFTGTDLLQVMATSLAQGLATQAVTSTVRDVLRERREAEAKREVDEAIARWKRESSRAQEPGDPAAEPALVPDGAATKRLADLDQHQHRHVDGRLPALGTLEQHAGAPAEPSLRTDCVPDQRVRIGNRDVGHLRTRDRGRRRAVVSRGAATQPALTSRSKTPSASSSWSDARLPASVNGSSRRSSSSCLTRSSR
jgi:hypothetical protein